MAYGFKPAYHKNGGVVRANEYEIASGYGTALYKGDPVALTTDGSIIVAAPGSNTRNVGVFQGVKYTKTTGEIVYAKSWPASQTIKSGTKALALVFDDPNIVFMVESDQAVTPMTASYIGASGDATAGSADTTNEVSGWFLDSSGTWGATAAMLKVVGSAEGDGDFTAAGTAMDVFVVFNEHIWNAESAGVATS